jgi:hypothetical protein
MTPRQKALLAVQEIQELKELEHRKAVLISQINEMLSRAARINTMLRSKP